MIRDLMQNKLEAQKAPPQAAPEPAPAPRPAPVKEQAPPVQAVKPQAAKEGPAEKSLDEIILDFLAQEEKARGQKK